MYGSHGFMSRSDFKIPAVARKTHHPMSHLDIVFCVLGQKHAKHYTFGDQNYAEIRAMRPQSSIPSSR